MNRRELMWGSAVGLWMVGTARHPVTARSAQDNSWSSSLPAGVTFETITTPTGDDLTKVSALASVSRNSWGPDANVYGACFDTYTGGPQVVIVESGTLGLSVGEPDDQWLETIEANALPTAFIASRDYEPVIVTPDTRLELTGGDGISLPYASTCGMYGDPQDTPAVFLEVILLPGSVLPPTNYEDLGMIGELLDISFGVTTFNETVPPVVIAGRLVVEAQGTLTLEDLGMPLALYIETGEAVLNAVHDSGLLRDAVLEEYEPSSPLVSGEELILLPNLLIYLPATATVTITTSSSLTCMMVGLDFASLQS